jgi:hypothetical protein
MFSVGLKLRFLPTGIRMYWICRHWPRSTSRRHGDIQPLAIQCTNGELGIIHKDVRKRLSSLIYRLVDVQSASASSRTVGRIRQGSAGVCDRSKISICTRLRFISAIVVVAGRCARVHEELDSGSHFCRRTEQVREYS